MLIVNRQAIQFASALARRVAALAGAGLLLMGSTAAIAQRPAPVPQQRAACPLLPATPVAGSKDGQFALQTDLKDMTASNMASFIILGKEAAAAGRPRDAEVAFLMSCRVADKLKGPDSVESANAKYQLGWLYARLALEDGLGKASSSELRRRAQRLYADSFGTYQAALGPDHEKTRFAAEGLATLERPLSPVPEGTSKPYPASVLRSPSSQDASAVPATRYPGAGVPAGPSFNCAKARSVPEKIICSDAELARLDRELGRVHAQARHAASDSAAFRRQNNEEWRWREQTCRDRECLLDWYAQRYEQLVKVIETQGQTSPAASR